MDFVLLQGWRWSWINVVITVAVVGVIAYGVDVVVDDDGGADSGGVVIAISGGDGGDGGDDVVDGGGTNGVAMYRKSFIRARKLQQIVPVSS